MAMAIMSRLVRDRLYVRVADVLFPAFDSTGTVWSAAAGHRADLCRGGL